MSKIFSEKRWWKGKDKKRIFKEKKMATEFENSSWRDDCFDINHKPEDDLRQFMINFHILKTMFSGDSEPSTTSQGTPWFDTGTQILKIRHRDGWAGVMAADMNHKIWVYRNDAPPGWEIDPSVVDAVCAFRSNNENDAYFVRKDSPATKTGGTWQQPEHVLIVQELPRHEHAITLKKVNLDAPDAHPEKESRWCFEYLVAGETYALHPPINPTTKGSTHITVSSGDSNRPHDHGRTWRPAAAVGTLQNLKLSVKKA